jgi:trans-2,3-dihydro-3-hydroxyanthranilate isomerase
MSGLRYTHVDVFGAAVYSGNSLPVFAEAGGLATEQMLRITQELRHFEAIFLEATASPDAVGARIFDLFEELPFAGHPLIGAAAVLHTAVVDADVRTWRFQLGSRFVSVTTRRRGERYYGLLDQGTPTVQGRVARPEPFAHAFTLVAADLHPDLPLEVVSTGLPYLIVPVRPGVLERARIRNDITRLLGEVGAQFAVLLDEAGHEIRHWNNDGVVEDIATGSAAGVVGAYLLRHTVTQTGEAVVLHQGRFTGRPSVLHVRVGGTAESVGTVSVGGDVSIVGHGTLEVLP